MDGALAWTLAGVLGAFAGAATILALRALPRPTGAVGEKPASALPSGADTVLGVLRSMSVVVDEEDAVLQASTLAHAYGIVRGDRIGSAQLVALVRKVRRDGEIREVDLDLPRGRGRGADSGRAAIPVTVRVAPLGERLVVVLVDDRTESRRLEAVRRDFVDNVSHELKTPVGALVLLAEAVLGASDDPEAVRRFAGRMQREAARLTALVQDLLDLSRIQDDRPLEETRPVFVDAMIEQAVDRCRLAALAKRIDLVTGGEHGLAILGDEAMLLIALGNLVDNAVKYSPENTRVAIGVRRAGDHAEISVTDQGIGIPGHELERIFERFYRVDPARSRVTGGTGLGLSIVKHTAAKHGGDVSVWSSEGAGSTFTLRLPLRPVPTPPAPPMAPLEETRP
jgi:two-component system, OmpR family, sensor histidine kinase SenX3